MDVSQTLDIVKQIAELVIGIWFSIISICSLIVRIVPPLPSDSKWLPIVKFIAKVGALNRHVSDSQRPL